jgi:DNA-binding NtrC family response regulator
MLRDDRKMPSHVLLVEDNEELRYAYVRMLENGGYVVHPLRDYVGVLELIDRQHNIGVLIVDIVMPTGTPHGVAIAGMVRQRRPHLPVVFLTGHPEYVGYLSDNEKFLLKPVDEGMLLAAVAACLKIDSDHVKER